MVVLRIPRSRTRIESATARAAAESRTLANLAGSVLVGEDGLAEMLQRVRETFALTSVTLLERSEDGWVSLASAGPAVERPSEADTDRESVANTVQREREAEQAIWDRDRKERLDAFQRETLLGVQDAISELMKVVRREYDRRMLDANQSGTWRRGTRASSFQTCGEMLPRQ